MFDITSGDRIPLKMKYDPSLRALAGDCFNLKGFSLPIISKINFLFSPTHVLEIKSLTEPSLNVLPQTPGNIQKMIEFSIQQCNFPHFEDNLRVLDNYSLSSIPALKLNNPIFIPPRASREIMISLHMIFSGILRDSCITNISLDYKSQKEIRSFYKSKIVAICKAYSRRSFMQCIGFGVVLARHGNKVSFETSLKEDILLDPEGFDIFALDLGLGKFLWDELNLSYPNRKQFKDMIALKN